MAKPTINHYPSKSRGHANHGWLDAYHSFSFASYFNKDRMNFGALRVINEDRIAPSRGFGAHPHDNMEIITLVLSGTLEHKDNKGGHGVISAGEAQHISAGSGIVHSEFNHSKTEPVHLLQIWIDPKEEDIKPTYSQKSFTEALKKPNMFVPLVTSNGKNGTLRMHQDAVIAMAHLQKGKKAMYELSHEGNGVHLFVIEGEATAFEKKLTSGDALEVSSTSSIEVTATKDSKILVLEVPLG